MKKLNFKKISYDVILVP